jgi:dihydrodipicolinate synthase/N-acetylneuraminate lyase
MKKLQGHCRVATVLAAGGGIDEAAMRHYLQRFVDAEIGMYLGSAGSGEGNALSTEELRRVYEIGVSVGKGKVQVNANPPEAQSIQVTHGHSMLAIGAGIEMVNIYGPTGWHSFKPTEMEFLMFFDDVLAGQSYRVALAPNPTMGYTPKPEWIAAITNKYAQVDAINLVGLGDDYLIELQRLIKRPVDYNVPLTGSMNMLAMGASGVIGGDFNLLPATLRRYLDLFAAKRFDEISEVYVQLKRFNQYTARWNSSNPRWIKMAMKMLRMPGGEGGLREPYRMPPQAECEAFLDGLLRLRIPEIAALASGGGVPIPD